MAFVVTEIGLCMLAKCDSVATVVPELLMQPSIGRRLMKLNLISIGGSAWLMNRTCIELDIIGANFSSLTTFATLLCTLTSALISFDSNKFCRKLNSCSLDKLSASLSDVTSFDKTANFEKEFYRWKMNRYINCWGLIRICFLRSFSIGQNTRNSLN